MESQSEPQSEPVQSVLLVEHDARMQEVICNKLEKLGKEVTVVEHALTAMDACQRKMPSLIIAEWKLPDMSGLSLLRQLRAEPEFKDLPFMMITAEADRSTILQTIQAGVDDLLIRPFSVPTLLEKVHKLLTYGRQRPHVGSAGDQTAHSKHPRILVVDDVPLNIETVTGILKEDYVVKVANNGKRALAIAESDAPPDLILLDVMMPGMDGLEVCRRLKSNPATAGIPVIFLTAKGEVGDIIEGLDLGAADYVTKPTNPAVLKARIAAQLRLSRTREDSMREFDLMLENQHLQDDLAALHSEGLSGLLDSIIDLARQIQDGAENPEQMKSNATLLGNYATTLRKVTQPPKAS